jgi:putative glutamine amidotransferase
MTKPVIAIPHWRAPTWERTKCYYDSLLGAGASFTIIDGPALPPGVRGLVLTGGVDVDPKRYGEKRGPKTDRPHRERDEQEFVLLMQALDRDIPVLCICRGHQLLNVAFGGSVLQDIDGGGHRWLEGGTSSWHEVTLEPGTRLAGVYGDGALLQVNSRHHQGVTVDRLARALAATAFSHDGYVEGLESTEHRWVMGVQWHPERPEMHPASDPLFAAFVAACRG